MKAAKNNGVIAKSILAGLMLSLVAVSALAQTVSPFNLPLYFEANHDQTEFLSRGNGCEFEISGSGAQMALRESAKSAAVAQMQFLGANAQPEIHGDGKLPGKINYLIGNDASQWQTGLPTFSKVQLSEIYPGINLVFHGNQQQLEYDFAIAPGANPDAIKIRFTGVDRISLTPDGQLVLQMGAGQICQPKPGIYQTLATGRRIVSGGYKILDARTVAFKIGNYDRSLPLVIDPVLSYASYFGSNLGNQALAIALDTSNCTYIAGHTFSKQFFTTGAFQTNFAGGIYSGDAFVAKFGNPATNLIYLTYLGGSSDDGAFAIAVDENFHAYVAGATESTNFPVINAVPGHATISGQIDPHVGFFPADAFVTELNADGSGLIYSTYLGGESSDAAYGIALDSSDNAYITGFTYSTNFPVFPNPASVLQNHLACTNTFYLNANAFVAEIANGGGALIYSTYLGGTNYDTGRAIAVDPNNYVYVAGYTASYNFPIINAPTNTLPNSPALNLFNGATNRIPYSSGAFDAFVTKFPPLNTQPSSISSLVYSTFLGGTNSDMAFGVAADPAGDAYVTGWTASTNFPVVFPSPNTNNPPGLFSFLTTNGFFSLGVSNVFLTKIAPQGSNILGSLVFGGNGMDIGYGVAVDSAGNAFVVGSETSTNFPTTNTFGFTAATNSGGNDVFVASFNPNWSAMNYSVCIGGNSDDFGYGIALDSSDNAFITGSTDSTNFPTQGASRFSFTITNVVGTNIIVTTNLINGTNFINGARFSGTNDAFLAEILFSPPEPVIITGPTNETVPVGGTATFVIIASNSIPTPILYQWQRETNMSGIFTNLINLGRFSGVTSNILTITNVQPADMGTYQIIVANGSAPIISNVTLTVESQPVIVVPPLDQTNALGTTAIFTVTALGELPLHYQWQFNGTNLINGGRISGVTTNTLTINNINTNDEGTYDIIITNLSGATNASATLTVITAPFLVTRLTNQVSGLGWPVSFVVNAIGGNPFHYSWTLNGVDLTNGTNVIGTTTNLISGATNNVLTIFGVTTNDDGTFAVTVTNAFGATNSSATLTVLTVPQMTVSLPTGGIAKGLTFNIEGGANGTTFSLLSSTNLLTPIDMWSIVVTNQFYNSGGTRLNTLLPSSLFNTNDPQLFFILRQP